MQSEGTSLVAAGSRAFRLCCRAFRLVTAYSNTRDKGACEGRVVKQRHNNKQSKAASQAVMKV